MNDRFNALLKECPIIAILRGITPAETPDVCDVLYDEGIRMLEITLNSQEPLESIRVAAKHCGDRQLVGAGTVLTVQEVRDVKQAGGTFIISPNTDVSVIKETKQQGMLSIPGFLTATEALQAINAGADYLKLFPSVLGPAYIKGLQAVIKTPILAVGGVNAKNIPDFLSVCSGFGIGGALYKAGKTLDQIRADARAMVAACRG